MSEYDFSGDGPDFEGLLSEALAPVEPPERPCRSASRRRLTTLTEIGGRGARGVGAVGDARPAQLGAARPAAVVRRRRRPAPRSRVRARRRRTQRQAPSAAGRALHARWTRLAGAERALREPPRDAQRCCVRAAMATCYRHPNRETGVSCSNCGRPICPDCMTPTPVGMRCPECARAAHEGAHASARWRPSRGVTYALIAINVVVFLAERQRQRSTASRSGTLRRRARCSAASSCPARRRPRRVLAARDRRLPARNVLHIALQHVPALYPRADARAGARARFASRRSTIASRCSPARSAR